MMAAIKTYSDPIGYIGTALIIVSYLALAAQFIGPVTYFWLGLISSLMMLAHGIERRSRPTVLLNAAWFAISAAGLIRATL